MSTSERIEKLAATIAEEVYIDIAKWHLYLNDAHLHRPLAEKFYALLPNRITSADVAKVLNGTMIAIRWWKARNPTQRLNPQFLSESIIEHSRRV